MEGGARQHLFERAQAPPQIGVNEEAPQRADEENERGNESWIRPHRRSKPGGVKQRQAAEAGEHHVDGVGPCVDQEVDMFGAVVDRVETPDERDLMAPAVAPVEADLAHNHRRDHPR